MSQEIRWNFLSNPTEGFPDNKRKRSVSLDDSEESAAKKAKISPEAVIQNIASKFGIQPTQFFQKQGGADILPRNISIYILKNLLCMTNEGIATYFGLYPGAIANALQQIKKKIQANNSTVLACLKYWEGTEASLEQTSSLQSKREAVESQEEAVPATLCLHLANLAPPIEAPPNCERDDCEDWDPASLFAD